MATDEPLYRTARVAFDSKVNAAEGQLKARTSLLAVAGASLYARAARQATRRQSELENVAGTKLQHAYRSSSGGGVPWVVDEYASWYKPHERARFSCVNCSGDVVPEKDLVGCWPLWGQFGPDELRFRCTRSWTSDPGENRPQRYLAPRSTLAFTCWQTCWQPLADKPQEADAPGQNFTKAALYSARQHDPMLMGRHCTASCTSADDEQPSPEVDLSWKWLDASRAIIGTCGVCSAN